LTFGGATTISGAVTPGAAAAVFTFNGPTTIAETFTPGAPSTIIGGTGAVTFAKALGSTATNTVIIKNTGGVTLTAENTIAAAIKATNVTIIGSSTGVTIDSDATDLTTTNGSVKVVETGAKIEAGGSTGKVTITGATLEGGTFTATDSDTATLTLGAGAVLTVEVTGAVTIGTAGQIVLTDGTSIIALVEGGSLAAPAAGGLIKNGGDATGVKLTVADKSEPETETYATVTDASPFIVTTATATGSGTQKVIVGKISWTIDKTGEVNAQAGATESGTIGTLKAGAGTVLLIDAST
jgi:hypothetical protein